MFVAYQTWTSSHSIKTVQRISLVAAIVLFLMVGGTLGSVLRDSIWLMLISPLSMILAGIFYVYSKKLLAKYSSLEEAVDWSRREKSTRRFLGWVAFLMWVACTHIIMGIVPKKAGYTHVPEESWWAFIALLGPILPIHLLYKAGIRIALRNKPSGQDSNKSLKESTA